METTDRPILAFANTSGLNLRTPFKLLHRNGQSGRDLKARIFVTLSPRAVTIGVSFNIYLAVVATRWCLRNHSYSFSFL